MSSPYVSSYDETFMKAFSGAIDQMPTEHESAIKKIHNEILNEVIEKLEYYVQYDMKSNLDGAIRQEAAKVAESMLMNALAGDDKQIRNLMGFNDWYMKHLYVGERPTQWKLMEALMERRPDIFVNEQIAQQQREIEHLKAEVKRLGDRVMQLAVIE